MTLDVDKLNFHRCEDEKIHLPESIQGYGYLFALDKRSHHLIVVSENVGNIFDIQFIMDKPFFDLLDANRIETSLLMSTLSRADLSNTRLPTRISFDHKLVREGHSDTFLAVVYATEEYLVIELEPTSKFEEFISAEQSIKLYSSSVAPRFKYLTSQKEMAEEMVKTIKKLTGMERVVLYRFNSDFSGKVIAEAKEEDMESYMDLYYPASDIPAQARALYLVNWVRMAPDIDMAPSPLIPTIAENGRAAVDLTRSLLRTFSPIHLQYIRNQGLRASFSLSLVTDGELYGLISCHSREPTYVSQDVRLQCENISQLFSWHLRAKEEEIANRKREQVRLAVDRMLGLIGPLNPIVNVVKDSEKDMLEALSCDGFIYYSKEETISLGATLPISVVQKLFSEASAAGELPYIREDLTHVDLNMEENGIVGVMIIPLFERKRYFTAWFRKEKVMRQKWAGVEKELTENSSKRERLLPRASFQVNMRTVRGKCEPFDKADIDAARRLNQLFLIHSLDEQERMQAALRDLEQQDRNRNEFLATLAHELRNPLAPITASVEVLELNKDSHIQQKAIDIIKRQSQLMSKLIADLMDVSRITQGKVKLEIESLNIERVIERSVEIVAQSVTEKNHKLIVTPPQTPTFIRGDLVRLSQVFSNILYNAVKYTESGGQISVVITNDGFSANVCVKDNGLGIPADRINDVFGMFTQISSHSSHNQGGLGIGLTLVKKLVALHEGEVFVESGGIGHGSAFTVSLPLLTTEPASLTEALDSSSGLMQSMAKKILFVDDNKGILESYAILCESLGHIVETVDHPKKAIQIYERFQPEIVFLDIGLPEMDGYELCQHLRNVTSSPSVLFIAQSGWGAEKDIEKALASGFDMHFTKPMSFSQLKQAIAAAVNKG